MTSEILFSDLYPANFKYLHEETETPVYPLPRTAISCKRHPGFHFDKGEAKENHGVEDNLRNWAMFALGKKKGAPVLSALEDHKHCQFKEREKGTNRQLNQCGESMDRLTGYYRREVEDLLERELAQTDGRHLQTRTGINRQTGTVEDGILYNRVVFEEGVHFWGQIMLPDDSKLYGDFYDFLGEIVQRYPDTQQTHSLLHLGTGRTRGLGRIGLQAIKPAEDKQLGEEERLQSFQERLDKFDDLIRGMAEKHDLADAKNDYFFAVTLHSEVILRDELLRYQGQIDENVLDKELGAKKKITGLSLLYQNAGIKRVTGWNELWGTPKTNEYAIEAGSVFFFRCAGKPDKEQFRGTFSVGRTRHR